MDDPSVLKVLKSLKKLYKNSSANRKWERSKLQIFSQIPIFKVVHNHARSTGIVALWQLTSFFATYIERLGEAVVRNRLEHLNFLMEAVNAITSIPVNFDPKIFSIAVAQVNSKIRVFFT